ncbi:uncharacterized protein LOC129302589 [Prosopis cineraria]|uniref:uncharacterized protein LOC129302589 n=1 Tax=Prosopis cineraria TaxID=364024 RepID=UPI00240F44EA|nr:uncharacterized protein LOC129302589 [Prosopis cineraria]
MADFNFLRRPKAEISPQQLAPPSNQTSPYYIHPNENPSLVLVSPLLDGSNYHCWARAMRMALLSKNKLKFIDGSISPLASTDPLFPIELQSRFSQSDIFRIADLQEEIFSLKQGDLSISEYFTQLKILWDELTNLRPIKSCTCGSVDSARTYRDEDYVLRFLKGLNDQFTSVKSQIMLLDPLPSINRVFSLVLQQERELSLASNSKILLAKRPPRSGFKPSGNYTQQKICTYCGKPRHTEENCYRKHGFPPGFKFHNSSAAVNNLTTQDSGLLKKLLLHH